MAIAAANLFTRNIFKEYLKPDASPSQEAAASKITSLVVKIGDPLVKRLSLLYDPRAEAGARRG